MTRHFINLTAGLEFLPELPQCSFIRIQSTACEQNRWDFLLQDLDYNFLMALAQGDSVFVYDTSRRKAVSRALDQGLSFIEYVLHREWYQEEITPRHKHHNVKKYFAKLYGELDKKTLLKVSYFSRLLGLGPASSRFTLTKVCRHSEHDGEIMPYRNILYRRQHGN